MDNYGDVGSSQIKFIDNMADLVAYTYNHCSKFPKRYSGTFTNRILYNITLAQEYLEKANDIKIDFKFWKYGKTDATYEMYRKAYERRQEFFDATISSLKVVGKLLKIGKRMEIQELIEDKDKVLKEFTGRILDEARLIRGVMKQDQRAFKRFSIAFGKDFSAYY